MRKINNITVQQAVEDGFVQVKSLKKLQYEDLFAYSGHRKNEGFIRHTYVNNDMFSNFGKVINIKHESLYEHNHVVDNFGWEWPISAFEK